MDDVGRAQLDGVVGAHEGVVEHQDADRLLRRVAAERVQLHALALALHVDDDVAERVHGAAVDGLEAERVEGVHEAVTEAAPVARHAVELDAVVVGPEDVVAVEVVGSRAAVEVLQGVGEPAEGVVADDVAAALHDQPVVIGVRGLVVPVGQGPGEANDDGIVGCAARADGKEPRVHALGQREHVARLGRAQRRGERGRVRHAHGMGVRGIGLWHRPGAGGEREGLVDVAIGIGGVQLEIVGRVGRELEDAARELRGHAHPHHELRVDAEERHRLAPRGRAGGPVAQRDGGVEVVVAGDEHLDAERDHGRQIELRGADVEHEIGASRARAEEDDRGRQGDEDVAVKHPASRAPH